MSCYYCRYARQAAKRDVQSVVGCPIISEDRRMFNESEGQLYEGWFYANRVPGDVSDYDNTVGRGAIIRGTLIASDGFCEQFDDTGVNYESRTSTNFKSNEEK